MRRVSLATLFGADPALDILHRFETSWLLPPAVLAGLRGLIALYIFTTIIFIWAWYGTHDNRVEIGQSFSYFTWLTYWGLGFYHLFAAIHTAMYARTGRSVLFDRWPRACRVLHGLLYTTITTFPILVTIVFWVILFKPPFYKETFPGWSNVRSSVSPIAKKKNKLRLVRGAACFAPRSPLHSPVSSHKFRQKTYQS